MTDARAAMLDRIRAGLAGDERVERTADYAGIPRTYVRDGMLDDEARLQLLLERLRDYDTHVVETGAASLPRTIASVLGEHREKKVIAADGLPADMLPRDFAFIPERAASLDDLNNCDGIVTTCSVAIAFTGSIVLTHGPGEGARRLSLVPDRHLCIVRAEQVVETVPEAFSRLGARATHPITLISGPSATADIEMTRIRGVHGPRFLDVVLVR
ncbi:MAG TPA: LUD domain-containing protein [Acidobacteriaceae bacterium]|jgi:L-lactate dehydrogenase complex protein LldG